MKRYLLMSVGFFVLLCTLGSLVIAARYWNYWESDGYGLVRYQLAKLDHLQNIDTVFVGDSSLGNAIEVKEFDRLTGSHSVNLALTGLYGYAGSLHFALRALDRAPQVKRVVIMHSPDMMQRKTEYHGMFFTLYRGWPSWLPLHMQLNLLQTAASRLTEYAMTVDTARRFRWRLTAGHGWPRWTSPTDYITQGAPVTVEPITLAAVGVNPDKFIILQQLANACRARGIDCVYMHGPLSENILARSAAYFEKGNAAIRQTDLPLACDSPLPMRPDQSGDAYDHIRPDHQTLTTAYYAGILTAYWAGQTSPCRTTPLP